MFVINTVVLKKILVFWPNKGPSIACPYFVHFLNFFIQYKRIFNTPVKIHVNIPYLNQFDLKILILPNKVCLDVL